MRGTNRPPYDKLNISRLFFPLTPLIIKLVIYELYYQCEYSWILPPGLLANNYLFNIARIDSRKIW